MAITTIRSTYALDVETMQVLERIAHRWKVSKSEALRRAIRAAEGQKPPAADDALQALGIHIAGSSEGGGKDRKDAAEGRHRRLW